MQRFAPYLGGVVALVASFLFISYFATGRVERVVPQTHTASSTPAVVPTFTLPSVVVPDLGLKPDASASVATGTRPVATVAPKKVVLPTKKVATVPVASTSPATIIIKSSAPPALAPSGNIGLDASATLLRDALVNIICYAPPASGIHSISGSGVFIDSKGIVLTNAHIAQYFLLADRGVTCSIRSGSPAVTKYGATLVYISPSWLRTNAASITQIAPTGTGEYDFALLAITKSVAGGTLPTMFSSIALATVASNVETPIVIATYGAQFLEAGQIQSGLFPTVVFGTVKDVFTFHTNTIDVLSLGGSAAAQEGSSGGGAADASGALVGTITTSTTEGATDTRRLSAITAAYIRGEYESEMGRPLDALLAEPSSATVSEFSSKIPTLEAIITANLP